MTEQELRALVREAISRHTNAPNPPSPSLVSPALRQHASHALFVLPSGGDTDGPCIIEPAVSCNHCGYCKSFGH